MQRHILVLLLLLTALPHAESARAQTSSQTIRVAAYNVLLFSDTTSAARALNLSRVLQAVGADILLAEEIDGPIGAAQFFQRVVKPARGSMLSAPFTDGPTSDVAMFFDSARVELIDHGIVPTRLRNIGEWTVVIRGTSDTLVVFGAHLKAGDSAADERERAWEATALRDRVRQLPRWRKYLLGGDLNTYSSDDLGYATLTVESLWAVAFVDPIQQPGGWHANRSFARIHTQSPRVREFEDGIAGGLDDRFDFILVCPGLMPLGTGDRSDAVDPATYQAFGNDGKHFNDSINRPPNSAVPAEVANALHDASDHLPVVVELKFSAQTSGVNTIDPLPLKLDLSSMSD